MLVATLTDAQNIAYTQEASPKPAKGEVLLKIIRMGICGSDIHAYYGKHPTVFPPIVQGHEFSAIVQELGTGVSGFTKGQRVTVRPQHQCGSCYYCQNGKPNVCQNLKVIGCQTPGAAQEYLTVPAKLLYPLSQKTSFDEAAMIEPVAVAVANLGAIAGGVQGKKILVLGGGTIGNLTAQTAKAMGAGLVALTDIEDGKLLLAKTCGIDAVINTKTEDAKTAIKAVFGAEGPDAILECVGSETTLGQAIAHSRKGSEIIIVGIYSAPPRADMLNVQEKELQLKGVLMYLEEDYQKAVQMVEEGRLQLAPLMSAHFPLKELDKAYAYIAQNPGSCMKVLIDVGESEFA